MTPVMDARPTPGPLNRSLAVRLVLPALIMLVAVALHFVAASWGDRRQEDNVRDRAEAGAKLLAARIAQYGDALYGVRGLFAASDEVNHREFSESMDAAAVARRFPGVRAISYAPLVAAADIATAQRHLSRSAERSGLGYPPLVLPDAPERGMIAPVAFIEPVSGNEEAYGFDLLSRPARAMAVDRTLQTGLPTATEPLRLVQEPGSQLGFLMLLATQDAEGRDIGIALAAFRTGDLIDRVFPRGTRDADIDLYDAGPAGAVPRPRERATVTYADDGADDALSEERAPHGRQEVAFDVMGRQWILAYAPDHALAGANQQLLDWLPLAAGAILALIAFWILSLSHRTERRAVAMAERMTESLRDSQTDLARSNAELERFAYVASHDLREPLRTITGFLGLLSRRYRDRLDDDGLEFIDLAVGGAKRMDALIAELLEYSRVGRGETTPEPTDLEAAWHVAERNLSAAIAEAEATVSSGPLPVVMADRGEMVQVLQNLLGNAIKYRGERAPSVHVSATPRGAHWEVTVEDDGPGIDPRHHDRIFVLLQRLHRHDEVEGTGMGLAICKKIVESHGGRIWVESNEGHGARFTFTLPAAHDAPPRPRPEIPAGSASS
jgi:signal transduction histidine kinase